MNQILNSGGVSYLGAADQPKRIGQVDEQVGKLQQAAKELSEIATGLTTKLASVIPAGQPPNEKPMPVPAPVLVPLANVLNDVWSDIRASLSQLGALRESIELS